MPITPDAPFPKGTGDIIRSKDWNDLVQEAIRLDNAKVNRAGDTITGTLAINGSAGVGGPSDANARLVARGGRIGQVETGSLGGASDQWATLGRTDLGVAPALASNYGLKVSWNSDSAVFGLQDMGADRKDAVIAWGDNANDDFRFIAPSGGDALKISGAGRVGIGVTNPGYKVDVGDRIRLRQGPGGTAGLWLFQTAPNADRAFIGMSNDGAFGFWGNNGGGWGLTMDTATGNVGMGAGGAPDPNAKLVVRGRFAQLESGTVGGIADKWSTIGGTELGVPPGNSTIYGLKMAWDTDSAVFGLINRGGNRKDAIITWGDDGNDEFHLIAPGGVDALAIKGGEAYLPSSSLYFTGTGHNHTGIGNTLGYAALENSANYNCLMILGRTTNAGNRRDVQLWDYLKVNGLLEVNGNANKTTGVFWGSISDKRLKKGIEPLEGMLQKLLKLQGVTFEWKDPVATGGIAGKQMGLVAQEVQKVFPEWVGTGGDGNLFVQPVGLEAVMIEAIKELYDMILDLKKQTGAKKPK
jgi:hypothetical protein